ncbi:hypothetical protein NDU88_001401 [Pleurodeles waltl]|uniref:Uncharacterized protein n=1 Tax=Pleurodeles waltl TaxID=8319 RepID=A0AAV7WIB7_PLEWA|nr:hypothetical protein NDU88_001401 [Pleurodeles waltl]
MTEGSTILTPEATPPGRRPWTQTANAQGYVDGRPRPEGTSGAALSDLEVFSPQQRIPETPDLAGLLKAWGIKEEGSPPQPPKPPQE